MMLESGANADTTDPSIDGSELPGFVPVAEVPEAVLACALREVHIEAEDAAAVGELVDVHRDAGSSWAGAAAGDGPPELGATLTVRYAAHVPGYRGWQWSVTVCLLDPARPTVSEVVLLPGPEALTAPAWVPWKERVRGADLGVGDIFPPAPDDERIVPAYVQSDDPAVEALATEVGLGRVRVLSRQGRAEAAERWHVGEFGPLDEMARHAPASCATCAFFVPLAGSLGSGFGVCANIYSPADGRVVDLAYGCGAHSEVTVRRASASAAVDAVVDELQLEVHQRGDAAVAGTSDIPGADDGVDWGADASDEVLAGADVDLSGAAAEPDMTSEPAADDAGSDEAGAFDEGDPS